MTKTTIRNEFNIRKAFEQEKYEEIFNRFIKNNEAPLDLDADEVLILGLVCEELDDIKNAEKFYQALGESGDDIGWFHLARISLDQGNVLKSFTLLEKLVKNGFSFSDSQENVPNITTSLNMVQGMLQEFSPLSNETARPGNVENETQSKLVVGFPSVIFDKNGNPLRVFTPHIFLPAGMSDL